MMNRRSLMTATTLLVSLIVAPGLVRAAEEPAKKEAVKTEEAAKKADFLFVQSAQSIHYADGKLTLTWTGTGILEAASSVVGPWTAVAPTPASPYTEAVVGTGNRFFRLKKP